MKHTKPISAQNGAFYKYLKSLNIDAGKEMVSILNKYGITPAPCLRSCIIKISPSKAVSVKFDPLPVLPHIAITSDTSPPTDVNS